MAAAAQQACPNLALASQQPCNALASAALQSALFTNGLTKRPRLACQSRHNETRNIAGAAPFGLQQLQDAAAFGTTASSARRTEWRQRDDSHHALQLLQDAFAVLQALQRVHVRLDGGCQRGMQLAAGHAQCALHASIIGVYNPGKQLHNTQR